MLARSRRDAVPIRRLLVQRTEDGKAVPGLLGVLVARRDVRGLLLYLLVLAIASHHPWDVTLDSRVWARALRLSPRQDSAAAISKVWHRLDNMGLIQRERRGRLTKVTLRREDGQAAYSRPTGEGKDERFFKLPHAFWLDDDHWYERLSLPGQAMLLIGLSLGPTFTLPFDRVPGWYGLSPNTAQRGFRELTDAGLLKHWVTYKEAPLAPLGYTQERHYRLLGPFAVRESNSARTGAFLQG